LGGRGSRLVFIVTEVDSEEMWERRLMF
jgi:hypothetical protein